MRSRTQPGTWLTAAVVLAVFACLGIAVTKHVHDRPNVARLERAVGRVEPPHDVVLLSSRSTDTCLGPCPAVERWYVVTDDPDSAVAAFANALTAAGFTQHEPLGPTSLTTWSGYGAEVSLQGFPASDDSHGPSGVPTAPAGDNYLLLQAFPEFKR